MAGRRTLAGDDEDVLDSLTIGRRVRRLRVDRGMTVGELGDAIGRAASQVSVIENGKRELKLAELQRLARALDTTLDALLEPEALSRRDELEIELERAQRSPLYSSLDLPALPVRKSLSDAAIETILTLHGELERLHEQRAATPEQARRANAELRAEQRARDNYYEDLEHAAAELLAAIGHRGGPLSQRATSELAAHLGFTLHYVGDLPATTRSIADHRNHRIYLPIRQPGTDARSALLQALAAHVLDSPEPHDFGDLLRQRVETNYLAGALLVPQASALEYLTEAKAARELSVEDLRDHFAVSYETAAHRFTNLATRHLGIPVHFVKVHASGAISKAYANDEVQFPTDVLGAVEGQQVCRWWSARQVFEVEDRLSPYHQYTDKPSGTFWCTSRIESSTSGDFSVSVGTNFAEAKWFRGRDTKRRLPSRCPDPSCCREPSGKSTAYWEGKAWPSARLNASLLAAMPDGSTTGVDKVEVYDFLDRHATPHP
ncbi:helix-turn-helix domain-containing protein [Pseudoclavibacter chungangensis]|uniref:Helix-turn-helix domain-containing protein n=1 Tax=Pseudoclavibacter chungangensis TaxID=587635 RepID=A0A7J5BQP7_9MICO|nr:XRE family transcriptional regulator [Pseudoclavibacter chungangensis]KAB1656344.1 helix-turn-helix domain-containing protein [Pseudoclavibacter chungangensis]NYJ67114.1 putative transcriptional regulator/DNA-binding Xre family transcriptional regulator [Pseudoclavibacter chungangensis]